MCLFSNLKSKISLSLSVDPQSKIHNQKSKIISSLSLSLFPQSKIRNLKSSNYLSARNHLTYAALDMVATGSYIMAYESRRIKNPQE